MYYLYILECSDKSLYTGITTDIKRRVAEHNDGKGAKYTCAKLPVKLVYQEKHKDRSKAQIRESEIKSWPRVKKLNIINS